MVRLIALVGSCVWWLNAGSLRGWQSAAASLVATAYSLPIAYWLGRDARASRRSLPSAQPEEKSLVSAQERRAPDADKEA